MEKSIQQLFAKDDMFWWKRLFENDPMNGRLSEEQRLECIAFAVKAGETAAEEYVTRYGKGNLEELARKLGLCIRSDESCGFQNYIYFGVFSNSGEITLYEENFRKLDDYIIKKALHIPITGRIARDIVLAHEIYHYYE